ncbi:MAG: hypothetical protein JW917_11160 [Ignavibacteria bacterium]|nr:hypothetical protein [Ignavibacteria bacterium]
MNISNIKAEYLDSIIKVDSMLSKKFKIGSIILSGNKVTKDFIILREMETKENDSTTVEILKEDYSNIQNLGLFNKVELVPIPDINRKQLNLLIDVEESFYILPIPQGGLKEGNIKKFWGGINFLWRNFRGRNETLQANFGIWYEPFVSVGYFIPWIGEKARFFGGIKFNFNKSIKKDLNQLGSEYILKTSAEDYKVFSYSGEIIIGKFLSKYFNISLGYTYYYIYVPDVKQGRSESADGRDKYSKISANISYDKRNNTNYTTHGTSFNFQISKYGFFNEIVNFSRVELNFKKFIPVRIKDDYFISYAFWMRGVSNFGGSVPHYKREVYGYDVYVRGWKDFIFEGDNSLGYFSEIRIPIITPFYVKGKDHIIIKRLPILKNLSYQYGLYIAPFFDIAGIFFRNQSLKDVNFQNGYGIGFNFILPFNSVFRIDVALNKDIKLFQSRFSFNLEAAF